MGWSVMTVWECQLKPAVRKQTLKEIEYWINKNFIEHMQPIHHYPNFTEEEDDGRMVAEEIGE
jgi:DNA mismatch endonuclease (patch repair protein)